MNDYVNAYERTRKSINAGLQYYMIKVYAHVAGGLLLTTLAAVVTLTYTPLTHLLFHLDREGDIIGYTLPGYAIAFAPFIIAMYVAHKFHYIAFIRSRLLLALYALLTGISLASLAFYYTIESLHKTILITGVTFGVMSIYGYTTNRDLSAASSFCIMAIWGLVISTLVNIFFQSQVVDFVTSFIGVVVFTIYVACNTQKLKDLYYTAQDSSLTEKIALMGAFSLYINFLNLFFYLLRFLGEQRRRD